VLREAILLRILLADDHDIVRRGLRELLEEQVGWEVCAEAANGRQAVELALEHRPQVAVLDLTMPPPHDWAKARRDGLHHEPKPVGVKRRLCKGLLSSGNVA
jgi:DNA-binding NarL/FixJ family response regulator